MNNNTVGKRKADELESDSHISYTPKRFKVGFSGLKNALQNLLLWKPSSTGSDDVTCLTSPSKIFSSKGCIAQTLTVSDQHATLILTSQKDTSSEEGEDKTIETTKTTKEVKSILKLTLVPFHKEILGSNPVIAAKDSLKPERNFLDNDPKASDEIISFLRSYNFNLKSESGAEYSYYNATPSQLDRKVNGNPIHNSDISKAGCFDVELISPASERQIQRVMPSNSTSLIEETPDMYNQVVKPHIQSIVDGKSLNWIFNIIEGKKEKERLLLNHELFIINIDTKWRSHPDAFKTPREEWYQHESTIDLYCLGIIKQKSIATLRDLTRDHIPMLKSLKEEGLKTIEKIYGVKKDQIRVFVHYHPQFYHFHVHFTRLHNEIGSQVERGHLISDIIQNLELDGDYYANRTISYKLKISSPLYLLVQQHEEKNETTSE